MSVTQYIGARYVPLFANPIDWDNTKQYEPLTIVYYQGNSYTSKQAVPTGIDISNTDYWAITGNYNAQIEQYRRVSQVVADSLPSDEFSSENTVKEYIDAGIANNFNTLSKRDEMLNIKACVDFYGADPTGIEDSSEAIEACIAANHGGTIWFTTGSYKISRPIKTPHGFRNDRVSINFNGATIRASAPLTSFLELGGIGEVFDAAGVLWTFYSNGIFINDYPANTTSCGITVNTNYKNPTFENMNILYFHTGIKLYSDTTKTVPCDAQIDNCYIYYRDMTNGSRGIDSQYSTDSKISNTRIYGYQYSMVDISFAHNVHNLPKWEDPVSDSELKNIIENSSMFLCTKPSLFKVSSCYNDSTGNFIIAKDVNLLRGSFTNCMMYSYLEKPSIQFCVISSNVQIVRAPLSFYGCSFYCTNGPQIKFIRDNHNPTNNLMQLATNPPSFIGCNYSSKTFDVFNADCIYMDKDNKYIFWPGGSHAQNNVYLIGRCLVPFGGNYRFKLNINQMFGTVRTRTWYPQIVNSNTISHSDGSSGDPIGDNYEFYAALKQINGLLYFDIYVKYLAADSANTPYVEFGNGNGINLAAASNATLIDASSMLTILPANATRLT